MAVKINEYSMNALQASLVELRVDVIRKLSTPFFKYFMTLYQTACTAVKDGTSQWMGKVADLREYQDMLKAMPQWNTEQIKTETHKILADLPDWPASDIVATIFYIKSMIIASIRPPDMTDVVYVPIASIESYLHACMRNIAKQLFRWPSIMRRSPMEEDRAVAKKTRQIYDFIEKAIKDGITDMTPTSEIVQKYLKQILGNVKHDEIKAREMDESEKYGFAEPIPDEEEEEDDDEEEDEYTDEDDLTDDVDDDEEEDEVPIRKHVRISDVHKK